MPQLINTAEANAVYQNVPVDATTEAIVELNALEITKVPDRTVWVDDNELGYTITVKNLDESEPGEILENLVVTDTIDIAIAQYVTNSATVTIGGVPVAGATVDYDEATGLLTVSVGDVPAGETVTIYFLVAKI